MSLSSEQFSEIVLSVLSTMVSADVKPDDHIHDSVGPLVVGSISTTGPWRSVVTIQCEDAVARGLAAAMFGVEAVSDGETADAVGELINVLGGNIKAAMPGPNQLSLPSVVFKPASDFVVPKAELLWARSFSAPAQTFVVRVFSIGGAGSAVRP